MTPTRSLVWRALFVVVVMGAATLFFTYHVSTTPPPAPDYDDGKAWLCRPGRDDACAKPTTATVFESGGSRKTVTYKPDPLASVDCFYLYPTVSRARSAYSPVEITEDETRIVREQFARFAAVCRPFAPLYRQVTIAGLPGLFRGEKFINLQAPYADTVAAWKNYLAKDNDGRAVVLVGHSQGARLLAKLIDDEIEGKPIQKRLVTAILPGTEIDVPKGKDVGGVFEDVPLCSSASQIGCVIAYSTYPDDRAVPPNASFGASDVSGSQDACVNPAALAGAATLDADLPMTAGMRDKFKTDFAELPGIISAACKQKGPFHILAVKTDPQDRLGESTDAFIDRVAQYSPKSGLHSMDINIALGTLIDLVRQKSRSFSRH